MTLKSFKKLQQRFHKTPEYWVEKAKLHYAVALNRLFKAKGLSQRQLAERCGTSPAYITKVFRGDSNFTIETMVKLAQAVDGELIIDIIPKTTPDTWAEIAQKLHSISPKDSDNTWLQMNNHDTVSTTS